MRTARSHPVPDLPRRTALVVLLALTIVGGALRFWRLDAPAVWGDEAATYRRTTGSYDDLLRELVDDGFTPLHYELYWWLSRGMPLWPRAVPPPPDHVAQAAADPNREPPPTHYRSALRLVDLFGAAAASGDPTPPAEPWADYDAPPPTDVVMTPAVLRIVPAVAGTLMVPAVYFLAAQVTRRRRVALLAALLAAASAYLLVYSRDAKMYMPLWLFATLHVACLLAWLHALGDPSRSASARRLWWWAWVAAGLACVGVHAPGLMVLAIDVIIFATAGGRLDPALAAVERRGRFLPEAVLRALDAIALPARAAVGAVDRLAASGATARAYALLGERSRLGRVLQRRGERFRWPALLPFALGLAVVAAGPAGYYGHFNRYGQKLYGDDDRPSDAVRWGASGLTWIEKYNAGRTGGDLALYAASAYLTGWEWPQAALQSEVPEFRRKLLKAATTGLAALLAVGLFPWRRAGARLRDSGRGASTTASPSPPFAWRPTLWIAAWAVLPAYGVYCASSSTFVAPLYWPAALVMSDVPDLKRGPAVVVDPEVDSDPADAGADAKADSDAKSGKRFGPLDPAWRASAAEAWSADGAAVGSALTPGNVRWGVLAALAAAGAMGFALCAPTWSGRLRTAGAVAGVVVVVWLACAVVYAAMVAKGRVTGGSVWMPRYIGVAWPAFVVAAAVLFSRLPTRPVRWAAVGLFVAVNLTQFAWRVAGDSEPPTGLIAADLIAAGPRDTPRDRSRRRRGEASPPSTMPSADPADATPPTQQTYYRSDVAPIGSPGTGVWGSHPMNYYLLVGTATDGVPRDLYGGRATSDRFAPPALRSDDADFAKNVASRAARPDAPGRVVIWSTTAPGDAPPLADPVLAALGERWVRRDDLERDFAGRDHWTWRDLYVFRRRVYERLAPPPATAAAPTTRPDPTGG